MMDPLIGTPLSRIDAPLKVTGRAPYAYEHTVDRPAYAALVMSTIAKGKITAIDTRDAEHAPGVLHVMTHLNSPKLATLRNQKASSPTSRVLQVLQDDSVFYANQPIAVVIAGALEQAKDAAQLVRVRYAREKHLVTLAARAGSAYSPPKAGGGGDPSNSSRGDLASGFAASSARIEHVYSTPFQVHNPMEPHATIAVWDAPDRLTIFNSSQGVFSDQERVAALLGLSANNVHVIAPYIGGGFGSKGAVWSHVILAALAARRVNRPVKLEVERPQMFGMVGYRSATRQTVAAAANSDGGLTALTHETLSHTSTFDEFVETASLPARMLYSTANNATTHKLVRSDLGTPSFVRAPGEAPGTFGLEVAMDEMAYELKMDPIAFRLKNYAEIDPEKIAPGQASLCANAIA